MRHLSTLLSLLLLPSLVSAQTERYELGRRLIAFEKAWDDQPDVAARKRALVVLKGATTNFFAGKAGEAGQALDRARFLLASEKEPSPEQQWAESLAVRFAGTLIDPEKGEFRVSVAPFYSVSAKTPAEIRFRMSLASGAARPGPAAAGFQFAEVPKDLTFSYRTLKEGDYVAHVTVSGGGGEALSLHGLSVVERPSDRLAKLQAAIVNWKDTPNTTDKESVRRLVVLLKELHEGKPQETNYPAARLFKEAEEAVTSLKAGKPYYGPDKAGQFWLALVCGKSTYPVRVQVPQKLKPEKKVPLVIALHGAGGSENLFFDAYGHGAIARLCEERGWLLVGTRSGFLGAPKLPEIIDELARLYPVDTERVFLVGHSMGAMQAVAAVGLNPQRYAGVAALGGGGTLKTSDNLMAVPFFVGIGTEDFLMRGAKDLKATLEKAGVKRIEYREYPDVEHLAVVQVALKDLFAFFDSVAKR